jgi:CMP-N-acetylneuraminic acid synthetase
MQTITRHGDGPEARVSKPAAAASPPKPRVVAIIPARGGSKGLPGKNRRALAGKPLLAHTIDAAKQCALIDRVLVTTDDPAIAEVARRHGAEAPFLRPSELARDDTPTEPVLAHAVEWLEREEDWRADIVVFFQPTDVFRKKKMVDDVVRRLIEDDTLDSVFVAYKTHKNFWRRTNGQWSRLAPDIAYGPRQTREALYREDTGLACATRARFIRAGRRIGDRVDLVITDDPCSGVDIHDEVDFWMADRLVSEGKRTIND